MSLQSAQRAECDVCRVQTVWVETQHFLASVMAVGWTTSFGQLLCPRCSEKGHA